MRIVVKLFGPQAQLAGKREVVLTMDENSQTCAGLLACLGESEPRLRASLSASRVAVNFAFVEADHIKMKWRWSEWCQADEYSDCHT